MKKAILILSIFSIFGCERQPKSPLTIDKIRNGEQLHLAKEISVSEFFQIWIRRDLPWKGNIQIMKVFQDDDYIYFFEHLFRNQSVYLGKRPFTKEPQLFKVDALGMQSQFAEYAYVDGFEIRKLCSKHIAYQNETSSNRFPASLFEYELKEDIIFLKITIDNKNLEFVYHIHKKELIKDIK